MNYWDTSALAKLYVAEFDSAQFTTHLVATGAIAASELARWELFRVLARKELEGLLPAGAAELVFDQFLLDVTAGRIVLIPTNPLVEDRFRKLVLRLQRLRPPIFTRTLDGVHLATADLHNAIEFVATDTHLRKCAGAIGLKLYP